jgi:hypothetical protein
MSVPTFHTYPQAALNLATSLQQASPLTKCTIFNPKNFKNYQFQTYVYVTYVIVTEIIIIFNC